MDDSGTPPLRKTVRRKFKLAQCDAQKVVAMEKVEETSGWSLKIKWFHFLFSYFAEPHLKWSAYRTGLEIEFMAFKLRNSVLVSLLPYVFEKKEGGHHWRRWRGSQRFHLHGEWKVRNILVLVWGLIYLLTSCTGWRFLRDVFRSSEILVFFTELESAKFMIIPLRECK